MDLPGKLRRERFPIARNDVRQVEMLAPVIGNGRIDDSRDLVEYRLRVAVCTDRAEYRLPDVVLAARAAAVSLREFHIIFIALRGEYLTQVVAKRRSFDRERLALQGVGARILVEVDDGIGAEIDGIRAGCECAVVHVRIKHLRRKRFPSAGGAAIGETCPARADAAETTFDFRDQLLVDGIPIRP